MRIIEINKCEECPHFEYAYTTDRFLFVCEHIDMYRKGIKDKEKIQKWCPLKEANNG